MLKEVVDSDRLPKKIAVCTCTAAFTQVLERLLEGWGFVLCRPGDPEVLLLVEEGCAEPLTGQQMIGMSSSLEPDHDRIKLPVKIESLWTVLEQHFHTPPRMHMRKAVDLSAEVLMRGEWLETRLSSLSDMGARFNSDRELVKQETVSIKLMIDGMMRQYDGKVIFSMAAMSADAQTFHSGMVFVEHEKGARDGLRFDLIRRYLETVRDGMNLGTFQTGLAFFDLVPEVRRALDVSA